jgi:excisionase family DNA binding protein
MPQPNSENLTPTQCARKLKCHISAVFRLILSGKLPARRPAGRTAYVVRYEDLERFRNGDAKEQS